MIEEEEVLESQKLGNNTANNAVLYEKDSFIIFSTILFHVLCEGNMLLVVLYGVILYLEIKLYLSGRGSCVTCGVSDWIFVQAFSSDDHKYYDILKKCS